MRRFPILFSAVGLLGSAITVSGAEMTETLQFCNVTTFAAISVPGEDPLFVSEDIRSQELLPFAEISTSDLDDGSNQASSHANLDVGFTPTQIVTSGDFSAQAQLGTGTFAEAFGSSGYTIQFGIDETSTASFSGFMETSGNGHGTVIFRITNGEILIYEEITNTRVSLDHVLSLAPGSYELQISANGYGQALPGGGGAPADGQFELALQVFDPASVPTPDLSVAGSVAYPNPARDRAVIVFQGARSGDSRVTILDASGRIVRDLLARDLNVAWDLRDAGGEEVPSGVYFARAGSAPAVRITVIR